MERDESALVQRSGRRDELSADAVRVYCFDEVTVLAQPGRVLVDAAGAQDSRLR